jgi:hypothetical protein
LSEAFEKRRRCGYEIIGKKNALPGNGWNNAYGWLTAIREFGVGKKVLDSESDVSVNS